MPSLHLVVPAGSRYSMMRYKRIEDGFELHVYTYVPAESLPGNQSMGTSKESVMCFLALRLLIIHVGGTIVYNWYQCTQLTINS